MVLGPMFIVTVQQCTLLVHVVPNPGGSGNSQWGCTSGCASTTPWPFKSSIIWGENAEQRKYQEAETTEEAPSHTALGKPSTPVCTVVDTGDNNGSCKSGTSKDGLLEN